MEQLFNQYPLSKPQKLSLECKCDNKDWLSLGVENYDELSLTIVGGVFSAFHTYCSNHLQLCAKSILSTRRARLGKDKLIETNLQTQ